MHKGKYRINELVREIQDSVNQSILIIELVREITRSMAASETICLLGSYDITVHEVCSVGDVIRLGHKNSNTARATVVCNLGHFVFTSQNVASLT